MDGLAFLDGVPPLEEGFPYELIEPCWCACCFEPEPAAVLGWAVPGVTGLEDSSSSVAPVSAAVAALVAAVDSLAGVDPVALSAGQALADASALLELEQRLRVLDLRRVGDVAGRGLHELAGFRSAKTWLRTHRPDGDLGDARLASSLRYRPVLRDAVQGRVVPLVSARKVLRCLDQVSPHLDKTHGLVDGQPGAELFEALVQNAFTLICEDLQGLHDDDPRLGVLLAHARELLTVAGSQAARLERICVWLASSLRPTALTKALEQIVLAILPQRLEDQAEATRRRRSLTLEPLPDGGGWHLCGTLDLECGERLWTALRAEAARDTANPQDTKAWADARTAGTAEPAGSETPGAFDPLVLPADFAGRTKRQRLHDALNNLLGRYLTQGLGGTMGKNPVQVAVTINEATVTARPGAPPARAASGRLIPRAMVQRWWCDSRVTAYVLSRGGKALRAVHGQRTPSAIERTALSIEGGARCVGEGCCPEQPNVLVVLIPHHINGYAEDQSTCLDEIVHVCPALHHDLHDGHKTIRLRDGRYLNEHGYVSEPSWDDKPPS